jgi:hypothetical protein
MFTLGVHDQLSLCLGQEQELLEWNFTETYNHLAHRDTIWREILETTGRNQLESQERNHGGKDLHCEGRRRRK